MLTLQLLAAAAWSFKPSHYVAYLQLEGDCITLHNDKLLGAASRDRTYQAIDENGDPIGATIAERVLDPSGSLSTFTGNPTSSTNTGRYQDQVGISALDAGQTKLYQYFVTSLSGDWQSVPTFVRTGGGDFMVFSIDVSTKMIGGKKVNDVSYNGDAGMWTADGSPRLPLCGK